jgi:methoxymalonate biosynthesis acyl carrier protein
MTADLTYQIHTLINAQLFTLQAYVTADTDLHAEGLDSLTLMQLILILEREFSIAISPEDLNRKNFSTLANIAALVVRKRNIP